MRSIRREKTGMLSPAINFIRTHRRWQIVALLSLCSVVNSLNRLTLSVLGPTLEQMLHFGPKEYSYIVASFLTAYALGYVFCGAIIDRLGVKTALAGALIVWSAASAMHAFAAGWLTLALYRFLLGLAESFTSPAGMKGLAEWVPARERGLSTAIFSNGNTVGVIFAMLLVPLIAIHLGWRAGFILPALTGFALVALWQKGYSEPAQDLRLTPGERQSLPEEAATPSPGRQSVSAWALFADPLCISFFVIRFVTDPVTYLLLFWIPQYLSHSRGFSLAMLGMIAWIPFFAMDLGGLLGGAISDFLVHKGMSPWMARRNVMLGAALLLPLTGAVVVVPWAWQAVALLALAAALQSCWMSNQLALISESVHQNNVGKALALSALGGSIGGIILALVAGRVIANYGYSLVFIVAGFLYVVGWTVLLVSQHFYLRSTREQFGNA